MIPNDKEINPAANVIVLTIYIYLIKKDGKYIHKSDSEKEKHKSQTI